MSPDAWTAFIDTATRALSDAAYPVIACYIAIQLDRHLRKEP